MSDGSLSQDEINALLAGVDDSSEIMAKGLRSEDLIGEEDEKSLRKAFAGIGKNSITASSDYEAALVLIKKNIKNLLELKKELNWLKRHTSKCRKEYIPDSAKEYFVILQQILDLINGAVASGYETLKDELNE